MAKPGRTYRKPRPRQAASRPHPAMFLGRRVSSVVLEVPCGDETHHVRIERDSSKRGFKVTMEDHPDFSPEMVTAFVTFGAKPPMCWIVAEQWGRDPWWSARGLTPSASKAPWAACRACGWESADARDVDMLEWSDLDQINEADPFPSGRCPECDSYVYPAFTETHPTIRALGRG